MGDWAFLRERATPVSEAQLQDWQVQLQEILLGSAAVSLRYFRQPLDVDNKLDAGFDPVTAADRECEAYIRAELSRRLPEHNMFGEESGFRDAGGELCWVVDPIDGTRSFICGVPLWGTLMALNDGRQPVLGAMYQPWSDELFVGSRLGSRLVRGGEVRPLRTAATTELAHAKLAATAPELFAEAESARRFEALTAQVQLRRFGTDCYGYALLAQGGLDLVVEDGLQPYDIQAMIPIVEGAGGVVTDWRGGDASLGGQVLAAANRELHAAALAVLGG